jgi:hypothetical protein
MGSIPFVCIQLIMVALIIMIPQMVMIYKAGEKRLDAQQVEEQFRSIAPPPAMDELPALKF